MKTRLSKRADGEMTRIDAQWRAESAYAPELFVQELLAMIELLERSPLIKVVFATVKDHTVRRCLLIESRYHVYYLVEREVLTVVSIWSSLRGRTPKLGQR